MEFELPEQARYHKTVPKTKFFARATVNTKLKREFTDLIQKITWEYKLAPNTVGIPATKNVEEVQIFLIDLKERTIPKSVLKVIDTSISYPILYVCTYKEDVLYGISLKGVGEDRWYFSDWNQHMSFRFTGLTLETLYQALVSAFINGRPVETHNFVAMVETDKQRKSLEKEIQALKNKIRNEKQFNKKVELNNILRTKQVELEKITL